MNCRTHVWQMVVTPRKRFGDGHGRRRRGGACCVGRNAGGNYHIKYHHGSLSTLLNEMPNFVNGHLLQNMKNNNNKNLCTTALLWPCIRFELGGNTTSHRQ